MKEFKWIKPQDDLPEDTEDEVIVCYELSGVLYYDSAYFEKNYWSINGDKYHIFDILAWSYIPEFKK